MLGDIIHAMQPTQLAPAAAIDQIIERLRDHIAQIDQRRSELEARRAELLREFQAASLARDESARLLQDARDLHRKAIEPY